MNLLKKLRHHLTNAPTVGSVVCVLGMHRSGTSALTGCLEDLGLYLGDVVREAPHNKKGNNENLAIRELHDLVLEDCGGRWDTPPDNVVWKLKRRQVLRAIIHTFANKPCWGFKDPRTLLTLSAWLEEIPALKLVGTFRHPQSVIRSITTRDPSFSPTHALDLWMYYNRKLLYYAQHFDARIICFDVSNISYVEQVQKLADHIGLSGNKEQGFFTPELRHWTEPDWTGVPPEAQRLYDELKQVSITP